MPSEAPAGKTILVVDDDAIYRAAVAVVLQRGGYAVVQAADGREAVDLLHHGLAPDLVLLDMLMPPLDGWGFMEGRRQDAAAAAVPVVIVTSLSIASAEWAAALGAVNVVRKPIPFESLLEEIRRHCPCANPPLAQSDRIPPNDASPLPET